MTRALRSIRTCSLVLALAVPSSACRDSVIFVSRIPDGELDAARDLPEAAQVEDAAQVEEASLEDAAIGMLDIRLRSGDYPGLFALSLGCDDACVPVTAELPDDQSPTRWRWSDGVTTPARNACAGDAPELSVTAMLGDGSAVGRAALPISRGLCMPAPQFQLGGDALCFLPAELAVTCNGVRETLYDIVDPGLLFGIDLALSARTLDTTLVTLDTRAEVCSGITEQGGDGVSALRPHLTMNVSGGRYLSVRFDPSDAGVTVSSMRACTGTLIQ